MNFKEAPDPGWAAILEVLFEGAYKIILVIVIGHLAYSIALGEVKEASSYGLPDVIKTLALLAGGAQVASMIKNKQSNSAQTSASKGASD